MYTTTRTSASTSNLFLVKHNNVKQQLSGNPICNAILTRSHGVIWNSKRRYR